MQGSQPDIRLSVETDIKFLPLVLSFCESSSRIFGLADADVLKLTLASEEVFAYLCRMTREPGTVTLSMVNGFYYARLKVSFEGIDFDPRAFNITANVTPDEEGLEEMGLLIAARSVDRMSIFRNDIEGTGFALVKEKTYPIAEPWQGGKASTSRLVFGLPGDEDMKIFARSVTASYDRYSYPHDLLYPGKIVDMVASGEYRVLTATDEKGRVAGGILWRLAGAMVESFGPYVFVDEGKGQLGEGLTSEFISRIARTEAVCLISRYATPEVPAGYFEKLGAVDMVRDGETRQWNYLFRQLREDPGCRVYAHEGMEGFLNGEYEKHFLARDIVPVRYEGERQNPHSVFGATFEHHQGIVTITPLWDGADARENLANHVEALRAEGISNILLGIDIGHGWQARLYPVIASAGFVPVILIPYRGKGDVVFFTLKG